MTDFGLRVDGTQKGTGFFGVQKMTDDSGRVMSEFSIGVDFGRGETEIPTLVPSLTKQELNSLLAGGDVTSAISKKAIAHAEQRFAQGKSPFIESGERATSFPMAKQFDQFGGEIVQNEPLDSSIDDFGGVIVEGDDQVATGFGDIFTGAERIAATPELGTLPRFLTTEEGNNFKITLGLLTTFDEKAQRDIIQNAIPEAVFETTPDGSTIIEVPTADGGSRRSVLNRPGFSESDITTGITQVLSFLPSARIAALGKTLLRKVGIGGTTAGATEAALQETGVALGREERDPGEVALAAGLGAAGEIVAPALEALSPLARQARQLDTAKEGVEETIQQVRPAVEAQDAIEQATAIRPGLFQAQQTLQPSTLLKQRLLPQLDAGARKAARELEAQNKEVFEATSELINTIAPSGVVEGGAIRFRTAAQKALESRRQSRSARTSPLFKKALQEGAEVDLTTVNELIASILEDAPTGGTFAQTANRLKNLISKKDGTPTLRQLQKAKIEMQDMIEAVGDKAVSTTLKREIRQVRSELVEKMRDASEAFGIADDEFARLSPAVTKLDESVIGLVAKLDDNQLKTLSKKIFDAAESNPAVVRNAKKIIDKVDPGAWDDLLRVEFQRRFGGIETLAEDLPGELVGNVPGQLRRAIFGNPEQRRTLLAAMNDSQRRNFVYLDDILRRASAGRAAGSPTAPFQQAIEKLRGVAGILKNIIFNPLDTLQKTGERGIFDANVAKLTDVLFNPKWEPTMKELTSLDPTSKRAENMFRELINASKASLQLIREE